MESGTSSPTRSACATIGRRSPDTRSRVRSAADLALRSPRLTQILPLINLQHAMSFRKRNVGLAGTSSTPASPQSPPVTHPIVPGVRPSPLDGRPTTSTGTQTLDDILAGHAGLALGNSLLVEENGTTDFAGALLRYYAAEGVVQGHRVHVVGVGEHWGRELPGLVGAGGAVGQESGAGTTVDKEKMKIAWRYERLGEFGAGAAGSRGGIALSLPCFLMYISNIHLLKLSVSGLSGLTDVHSDINAQPQPGIIKPRPIRLHVPNTVLS